MCWPSVGGGIRMLHGETLNFTGHPVRWDKRDCIILLHSNYQTTPITDLLHGYCLQLDGPRAQPWPDGIPVDPSVPLAHCSQVLS